MSQCVTPELQGSTANQPPRRGFRGAITQALHHHARGKAITSPFPCTVIPTPQLPSSTLKSRCTYDQGSTGWRQRWLVGAIKKETKEKKKKEKTFSYARGLFKPFNI